MESEYKSRSLKRLLSAGNFFAVFIFLCFVIIALSIQIFLISKPKEVKDSQAFLDTVTGLLPPPSNLTVTSRVDSANKEVDLIANWQDNSDSELGFVIVWYVNDISVGSRKLETPNLTSTEFYSIPCSSTEQTYSVSILISAYNDDDVSVPVVAEASVVVPDCSQIGGGDEGGDPWADINRDKRVDILDYSVLFENFGLDVTKNLMCEIVE